MNLSKEYQKLKDSSPLARFIIELTQIGISASLIAAFLLNFVVSPSKVEGISMQPTLIENERILLTKVNFGYARGDIIVIDTGESQLIKRIIAIGGDTIEIRGNEIYVNDIKIEEEYVQLENNRNSMIMKRTLIPEGYLFVLGDNRDHSNDSRGFGLVAEASIEGVARWVYLSHDETKPFGVNLQRMGTFPEIEYQTE